jgi:NAD(P)-dependent dehydrogenase (short-subunit alcohol dehydrogenase family)
MVFSSPFCLDYLFSRWDLLSGGKWMDLGLKGRTALVTGGSKGIGRAVAERLAEEGVNLHLAARGMEALQAAAAQIHASHGVAVAVHEVDLARRGVPEALGEACAGVDILVNNAGAIPTGGIAEVDADAWRTGWDLKVFGAIDLTRRVYAAMKERRRGVIVNVIGLSTARPARYMAGATANAALNAFTRALGGASMDDGIRVVGVNPGWIRTERMVGMLRAQAEKRFGDEERWVELLKGQPAPGEPAQVADMVAFLASERAAHVSGTVINVDGGASARGGIPV